LTPGWEGPDWKKMYHYITGSFTEDHFDQVVSYFPYSNITALIEEEKQADWNMDTPSSKATLSVYLDFFANFQRRMDKMPFNNYTPVQVKIVQDYIKDYFVPKYASQLSFRRSNL
jgi:hypothetical protein